MYGFATIVLSKGGPLRVLVTGASGFIGRWAVDRLAEQGANVYASSLTPHRWPSPIVAHVGNLLDPSYVRRLVEETRPQIILHLAWNVEHGIFWNAVDNLDWVAATLGLARGALDAGVERFVGVGTCFEYRWPDEGECDENATPIEPTTLYAVAKDTVRRLLEEVDKFSFAWARLFYLYGPFKHEKRRDLANYLQLSMTRKQQWFEGRQTIRDVMAGRLPATFLPNVYHSLVARETLEKIYARTGRVFSSFHCDTYSSFAVAYLTDRYLSVSVPMSVSGFSGSSNNIAFGFMRGKHPNTRRHREENAAAGLKMHPWVPDLPIGWAVIADSFLAAKCDLFPDDSSLTLDRKFLVEQLFEKMPIDDVEEWPHAVAEIRQSLSDDAELMSWFDKRVNNVEPKANPPETYRVPLEGLSDGYLHLDTSKYRVENVASAVHLAAKILGHTAKPIDWRVQGTGKRRLERFLTDARLAIILAMHQRWRQKTAISL